ncbi:hypothetical protein CKAH01_17483 [Colletotrichum kahawae]|uniref:Uncharacterized protein n=1 Tax=Colletotrichum kahawae TaxID=34407 RepID=A0AAD9YBM2_COLKA|nr:hypothetical protein CKAH01_17483 [Colletotrichum kahawae]
MRRMIPLSFSVRLDDEVSDETTNDARRHWQPWQVVVTAKEGLVLGWCWAGEWMVACVGFGALSEAMQLNDRPSALGILTFIEESRSRSSTGSPITIDYLNDIPVRAVVVKQGGRRVVRHRCSDEAHQPKG